MRKYVVLILFTIVLLTSLDILSSDGIEYVATPNDLNLILKYKTDFETVSKIGEHNLDLSIPHYFTFQGDGGASMWVEGLDRVNGPAARSGSRSIGMELTDITSSRRNEFNIFDIRSLAGDDILVSVWLYLPSDWGLHSPDIDENWYEIVSLFGQVDEPWNPYIAVHIGERGMGGGSEVFDVHVNRRDLETGNLENLGSITNFSLPRGRWFNIKWELHRHDTDSRITIWFDDQLITDKSGIGLHLSNDNYKITIGKIYYDITDTIPHYLWIDDLEIFSIP